MRSRCLDRADIVRLMLFHGVKINAWGREGGTPLLEAILGNSVRCVGVLLNAGARPNMLSRFCDAPLSVAAGGPLPAAADSGLEVMRQLIAHGADVNYTNPEGWTALLAAAEAPAVHGRASPIERVKLLVDRGAKVNAQDKRGETPLIKVCRRLDPTLVAYLLRQGANVDLQAKDGKTALMVAIHVSSDPGVVKALLAAHPNMSIQSHSGDTAMSLAKEARRQDIVDLLTAAAQQP